MKTVYRIASVLAVSIAIGACSSTSGSTPTAGATKQAAYAGKVFVTEQALPAGVKHTVLGKVRADARAGYSSGTNLYPLLADEARKMGANAVISVEGGRKVTLLSWAAAFVSGTAIKIDPAALKALKGTSH